MKKLLVFIMAMLTVAAMVAGCGGGGKKAAYPADGDITVIAAVKSSHPNSEFLEKVRNHKNADIYRITKENRDSLYRQLSQDWRLI